MATKHKVDGLLGAALTGTRAASVIGKEVTAEGRAVLEHFALRGEPPKRGKEPLTFAAWQARSEERARWARLTGKNPSAKSGDIVSALQRVARDAGNAEGWAALEALKPKDATTDTDAGEVEAAELDLDTILA